MDPEGKHSEHQPVRDRPHKQSKKTPVFGAAFCMSTGGIQSGNPMENSQGIPGMCRDKWDIIIPSP